MRDSSESLTEIYLDQRLQISKRRAHSGYAGAVWREESQCRFQEEACQLELQQSPEYQRLSSLITENTNVLNELWQQQQQASMPSLFRASTPLDTLSAIRRPGGLSIKKPSLAGLSVHTLVGRRRVQR